MIPDSDIADLRRDMLAFARLQISDPHLAEDAVQEALAGALKNAAAFARKASLKTWVFAILRNKIADLLRSKYREPVTTTDPDCKHCAPADDQYFDDNGHWQQDTQPRSWGDTHWLADNADFWKVFDACLNDLPAEQARVFMMREFIELTGPEICATLELSSSNLHVLLHRARLRLRACLSGQWFGTEESA
ncbi:MAG TPA: RNA polymerase subunit sigma [Oceanospirillales bacterium]|nr:RNA polymerase subunit sigma [Oceanospirillales bacterium]|tara:strand:- start:1188 stop:1760 length:573 start_codon:yes stop_codon:yes gene_type:complete